MARVSACIVVRRAEPHRPHAIEVVVPSCISTTPPVRPLPVGAVPAWLRGPFCRSSTPFMPLPPSHVPIVAELIRQGRSRTTHIHLASQPWLVATSTTTGDSADQCPGDLEACSIHALKPVAGFPIGDKKASSAPTVSAPNRPKRDTCCNTRNPSEAA